MANDGSSDTDIQDATGSTYTPADDDEGKTIQVRVSFTDDAGNEESLASAATGEVAAAPPPPLSASHHDPPATHDGQTSFTFELRFSEEFDISYKTLRDHAFTVTGGRVTKAERLEKGSNVGWQITVMPDSNGDVTVVLPVTTDCDDDGAICTQDGRKLSNRVEVAVAGPEEENIPATGAPTVSGTAQAGQTLTAGTTGIADADGLTNATFTYQWLADDADIQSTTASTYELTDTDVGKTIKVRVSFTDDAGNEESLTSESTAEVVAKPNTPATGQPTISGTARVGQTLTAATSGIADQDGLANAVFSYQWLADDADISGATGSSYTLTSGEQGKTVKVRVYFTDDAGNDESLTSAATVAVAAPPPLTVSVTTAAPATHDGSAEFIFEIRFSEEPHADFSYRTLRDHAFQVTGGTVKKAQRLQKDPQSNIPWKITVQPDGNGDVTVVLPVTTDCGDQGAVCTGDGRKLSNSLNFTVSGPSQ